MTQYLTPGLSATLQHAIAPIFWHTYTCIPRTMPVDNSSTSIDESLDDWHEPNWQAGTPVPDLPCLFQDQGRSVIGANGLEEVTVPTILVPTSDPINVGDKVQDVIHTNPKTGEITLVFSGPSMVENTTQVSPGFGGALYTQCLLRIIEEV